MSAVPPVARDILDAHGYDDLKKTQEQAFEAGILDGGNHLLVADTGNGKTLCAEAVAKQTLDEGGRVAYLVPSRQLVRDKREAVQEWCDGDVLSGRRAWHSADVAVATFDSYYQAILRDTGGARGFDRVILDDFHEVYGSYRGPAIEKTIAAILDNDIPIFAMSATLGNPEELAGWMDAQLIESEEERQVPIDEIPVDASGSQSKKDQIADLVAGNADRAPFIVFNASRNKAEARASAIADTGAYDDVADVDYEAALKRRVDGRLTPALEDLAEMLDAGVAYHHAGLPNNIKEFIEDEVYEGNVVVLCSTTTIAYGFDAPIQSVVVGDLKRYDFEKGFMTYVGTWEYVQWIGRAARPGMGYDEGYAYVLTNDLDECHRRFTGPDAELEPVRSHIEDESAFRWFLLELIHLGWQEPKEIEEFIYNTLYFEQLNEASGAWGRDFEEPPHIVLERELRETADWLEREGFVEEQRTRTAFETTPMGAGAVRFNFDVHRSCDLETVGKFYRWLDSRNMRTLTPHDMAKFVAEPFWVTISGNESDLSDGFETVLSRNPYDRSDAGQTAALLFEYWIRNFDEAAITETTGVDATYLGSTAGSMANLFEASEHLFDALPGTDVPEWLDAAVARLEEGVRADQLPLVEAVGYLGRYRVRGLHEYLDTLRTQGSIEGDTLPELLLDLYEGADDTQFRDSLQSVSGIGSTTAENIADHLDGLSGEHSVELLPGEAPLGGEEPDEVAKVDVTDSKNEVEFESGSARLDDFS